MKRFHVAGRKNGERGRRWGWIPVVLIALAACGPKSAGELESAGDLSAMLEHAGAAVAEASAPAPPGFDTQDGRALQVNEGLVFIYKYASAAEVQAIADRLGEPGAALPWDGRVSIWRAGTLLVIYPGMDGGLLLLLSGLLGDPESAAPSGPEEPYPPAVAAAIAAWAEAQKVDPASVEVVGYAAAEWLNHCLGLPEPGEACAAGPVNGWVVEIRAGDRLGTVHTDAIGLQVRLVPAPGS